MLKGRLLELPRRWDIEEGRSADRTPGGVIPNRLCDQDHPNCLATPASSMRRTSDHAREVDAICGPFSPGGDMVQPLVGSDQDDRPLRGGVPGRGQRLRVLHLKGTPYEMGYQQGALLATTSARTSATCSTSRPRR